jgi:hypothetical protein
MKLKKLTGYLSREGFLMRDGRYSLVKNKRTFSFFNGSTFVDVVADIVDDDNGGSLSIISKDCFNSNLKHLSLAKFKKALKICTNG